jgi:hypothetical protein
MVASTFSEEIMQFARDIGRGVRSNLQPPGLAHTEARALTRKPEPGSRIAALVSVAMVAISAPVPVEQQVVQQPRTLRRRQGWRIAAPGPIQSRRELPDMFR